MWPPISRARSAPLGRSCDRISCLDLRQLEQHEGRQKQHGHRRSHAVHHRAGGTEHDVGQFGRVRLDLVDDLVVLVEAMDQRISRQAVRGLWGALRDAVDLTDERGDQQRQHRQQADHERQEHGHHRPGAAHHALDLDDRRVQRDGDEQGQADPDQDGADAREQRHGDREHEHREQHLRDHPQRHVQHDLARHLAHGDLAGGEADGGGHRRATVFGSGVGVHRVVSAPRRGSAKLHRTECGREDSNLHGLKPPAPKAGASTNSATPARVWQQVIRSVGDFDQDPAPLRR